MGLSSFEVSDEDGAVVVETDGLTLPLLVVESVVNTVFEVYEFYSLTIH